MTEGVSWSGRERNNVYLNLGDGSFADCSRVSGVDFEDDGRAVAVADWDGDGDLDLWLRNRTGPQLRFMRNDGPPAGHWVSFALSGTSANRDAIGATVEVVAGDGRRRRQVIAGDGYLAQSSRRLHFGLGAGETIERLHVRWPGGAEESFPGPAVDRAYRIEEGRGELTPLARRAELSLDPAGGDGTTRPPKLTPVLLKEPLPVPPTLREVLYEDGVVDGRPKLLSLWAHWCAPCLGELAGLAGSHAEIRAAGADVVALNVDLPQDREQAARTLTRTLSDAPFTRRTAGDATSDLIDALFDFVLQAGGDTPLPTSLLVDERGMLQLIYLGPLDPGRLLDDLSRWTGSTVEPSRRGLYPGRWYFRTPRDLVGLASELKARDLREDARFFLGVVHVGRSGTVSDD